VGTHVFILVLQLIIENLHNQCHMGLKLVTMVVTQSFHHEHEEICLFLNVSFEN
jgi:hypothetical protein